MSWPARLDAGALKERGARGKSAASPCAIAGSVPQGLNLAFGVDLTICSDL